jgi:branched-chain amino acid transport system ATP-binding protein
MLTIEGVSAGYGRLHILSEVSMTAEAGQVTVILGPNGSGKSTLLKTISGHTSIYAGKIELDGEPITGLRPHKIIRKGLAHLRQTGNVFAHLTVFENLKMAGYIVKHEDFKSRLEGVLVMFPPLRTYLKSKVVNLSGGERQMLAMSMALLGEPRVMMFDEPTANLSPKLSTQVLDTIKSLAKVQGLTILLAEQNAKKALEMGDKAYLLVGGRNIYSGSAGELLHHSEFAKMYLGLTT